VYRKLQQKVLARIEGVLKEKYQVEVAQLVTEQPPKIALGELALPVAFELAKRLKKAPRAIASELQAELAGLDGVASVEIAGAGYLNIKLDRSSFVRSVAAGEHSDIADWRFILIEHTSINPNKAAHIGHLRNAILGDTLVRLLRKDNFKTGFVTGVQNYIDNTGVQVADVVVGLTQLEGKSLEDVERLIDEELPTWYRLGDPNALVDIYCWNLYARVSQWYTEVDVNGPVNMYRRMIRLDTLHAIETGGNETAKIAELISTAVLRRHLETMQRLGIEYDFLPRESEILHLKFWEAARALLIEKKVLEQVTTEGKNKGCWIIQRTDGDEHSEDAKVIERPNGTVTYVGKDIAYQLWKFGLLPGKNFGMQDFYHYSDREAPCWISTSDPNAIPSSFGKADAVYNVIDARQSDPQNIVKDALRRMGYEHQAAHYTHFSYEMVVLTPRCAEELGYTLSEEDSGRAFIEVSGRKGFGVKADDLLDKLIAAAKSRVDARQVEMDDAERTAIAKTIAVAALRYFMLKFTRNTVIAFDFRDALSVEGETGPYVQYAVVRAGNILRKAGVDETAALDAIASLTNLDVIGAILSGEAGDEIWELWLEAARLSQLVEQCIQTAEPAYLAKYAFQLAQKFSTFYQRHHVLTEQNATRKSLLLATTAATRRALTQALAWLGIDVPSVM
jgi:arginyl-tRNA synthetase